MNKNYKYLFISLIFLSLMISITTISANDLSDNNVTNDNFNQFNSVTSDYDPYDTQEIVNDNNINSNIKENNNRQVHNILTTTYTKEITPSNIQSELLTINNDTTYDFSGTFTNMGTYTFTNLENVVFTSSENNAYMTNTQISVSGNYIEISYLNISNTDYTTDSVILTTDSTYVYIHNNQINTTTNNSNENHGISTRTSTYVNITANDVKTEGYHQNMGWNNSSGQWAGAILVSGIEVAGTANSNIILNNITVLNLNSVRSGYESIEGLTVKGSLSQNILVKNNNITLRDGNYNYGTTVSAGASNVTLDNNTFNITGPHYVCAIQYDNIGESYILKQMELT